MATLKIIQNERLVGSKVMKVTFAQVLHKL